MEVKDFSPRSGVQNEHSTQSEEPDYLSENWPYADTGFFHAVVPPAQPARAPTPKATPEAELKQARAEYQGGSELIVAPCSTPAIDGSFLLRLSRFSHHVSCSYLFSPRRYPPVVVYGLCALMFTIGFHATGTTTAPAPEPEKVPARGIFERANVDTILLERFAEIDRVFATAPPPASEENALSGSELIGMLAAQQPNSDEAEKLLAEAGRRKDERITKVLSTLARSDDAELRAKAVRALGSTFHLQQTIGYEAVVERLKQDQDDLVRAYAAKALSLANHDGILEILQQQLREEENSFVTAVLIRAIDRQLPAQSRK